jgi:hypothetical protein
MNEMPKQNRGRKWQRRLLVGLAMMVTLVALFYLEEDWRGKRAWEVFKQEMEAKGMVLDWDKFVPSPVPDDQNFFTASTNILLRFKKAQGDAESDAAAQCSWLRINYDKAFPSYANTKTNPLLVAVVDVVLANAPGRDTGAHDLVVKFNDPGTAELVRGLMQKTLGRSIQGAAGFLFSEFQLSNIAPARIELEAASKPSVAVMENFIPQDLITNLGQLRIEADTNDNALRFRVLLSDVKVTASAADYLKWTDQFVPALDEVREALKRPYALLPGDYSQPTLVPIPNFVELRAVAQTLAQRAQCDFLLGRPEDALREITLIHDLCRMLKRIPPGQPITLVESMINVAIAGLYANTVADGLRLHAWKEPQLAALQAQLKDDDLISPVVASLSGEQAATCFSMLHSTPELTKALWGDKSFVQRLKDPAYRFFIFAPRGWLYQNAISHVRHSQAAVACYDASNQLIFPKPMNAWPGANLNFHSPYSFLEAVYLPNMSHAAQRTAYNQTWVNEAMVACALERCKLARGEYPETLEALVPQYIDALPHDVIGGQPLHYRRASDGTYVLYSVGWDEVDEGGTPGPANDLAKEDWVWNHY